MANPEMSNCNPPLVPEVGLPVSSNDIENTSLCKHQQDNEPTSKIKLKPSRKPTKRERKLNCIPCGYTAKTQKGIERHKKSKTHISKTKNNHSCTKCNVCNSKALSDLKKCPQCSYTSDNIKGLKLHMNIHSKGTPFKCSFCNYAAQNVRDLVVHYKAASKFCSKPGCSYVAHIKEQLDQHKKVCKW